MADLILQPILFKRVPFESGRSARDPQMGQTFYYTTSKFRSKRLLSVLGRGSVLSEEPCCSTLVWMGNKKQSNTRLSSIFPMLENHAL